MGISIADGVVAVAPKKIIAGSNITTTETDTTVTINSTGGSAGSVIWGDITGTLSNQTDLQTALNNKADTTSVPAQFNPIAGTNITLSGSYPNITFNSSGSGSNTISIIASENISNGDLCNLWNNSGTINVRKADASSSNKEAHHFVIGNVTALSAATVSLSSPNSYMTGLTVGKLYLSTTPGKTQTTPPTGSGQIVQVVGTAISATNLDFQPQIPLILA